MKKDWTVLMSVRAAALLLGVLCVAAVGVYQRYFPSVEPPEAPQVGSMDSQGLIERGCVLHQTLQYAVCGHSVERNLDAPDTVLGMNREVFAQAMADWRVTAFASQRIEMARTMEMPCPAHWVIRAGADGKLGVYRNLYGEELCCLRELDMGVSAAPESDEAALRVGLCFDTEADAEVYIESIQSRRAAVPPAISASRSF